MKHLGVQRSTMLENSRRVPLNTIILPPISPPLPEKSSELIGRVQVSFLNVLDLQKIFILPLSHTQCCKYLFHIV